ncbi:unnamed protein product [Gordionus sp. m RMFG-2023]
MRFFYTRIPFMTFLTFILVFASLTHMAPAILYSHDILVDGAGGDTRPVQVFSYRLRKQPYNEDEKEENFNDIKMENYNYPERNSESNNPQDYNEHKQERYNSDHNNLDHLKHYHDVILMDSRQLLALASRLASPGNDRKQDTDPATSKPRSADRYFHRGNFNESPDPRSEHYFMNGNSQDMKDDEDKKFAQNIKYPFSSYYDDARSLRPKRRRAATRFSSAFIMPYRRRFAPACPTGQFPCPGNGRCVPWEYRCDRVVHCEDYSDELGCSHPVICRESEFKCDNGQCIHDSLKCNQVYDCLDTSDERDCSPMPTTTTITSLSSIWTSPSTSFSLSTRRSFACPRLGEGGPIFKCSSRLNECIEARRQCDSHYDCSDRSDEIECPTPSVTATLIKDCTANEFQCSDGKCIDIRLKCNSMVDCTDASDERECSISSESPVTTIRVSKKVDVSNVFDTWSTRRTETTEASSPTKYVTTLNTLLYSTNSPTTFSQATNRRGNSDEDRNKDYRDRMIKYQQEKMMHEQRKQSYYKDMLTGSSWADFTTLARTTLPDVKSSLTTLTTTARISTIDSYDLSRQLQRNKAIESLGRSYQATVQTRLAPSPKVTSPIDVIIRPTTLIVNEHGSSMFEVYVRRRDQQIVAEEIEWSRTDGRALPPDRVYAVHGGRRLVVGRVRLDDAGSYLCRVSAIYGRDRISGITSKPHVVEQHVIIRVEKNFNLIRSTQPSLPTPATRMRDIDHPRLSQIQTPVHNVFYRLRVEPAHSTAAEGQSVRFKCVLLESETGKIPSVTWVRLSGGSTLSSNSLVRNLGGNENGAELILTSISPSDQGHYGCVLPAPYDKSVRAIVTLRVTSRPVSRPELGDRVSSPIVEQRIDNLYQTSGQQAAQIDENDEEYVPTTTLSSIIGSYRCQTDEATCQNGQCIKRANICDGLSHCSDGSDERNCRFQKFCEPNEYRCNNGRCVQKIWRCDGDDDCGDQSDELNCATNAPGSTCSATEWRCMSRDQCVPASYQCDGETDCADRSDEIGCSPPVIVSPPTRYVTARRGETVQITCAARGTPVPLVSWRLNWGHLPAGPRVSSTSHDGRGILTIRGVRKSDQGAYSCEAINNRDAILATPDAILTIVGDDDLTPTTHTPPSYSPPREKSSPGSICQPPYFNSNARTPSDCVSCFCSGRTTQCFSSDQLYLSQIALRNTINLAEIDGTPIPTNFIRPLPDGVSIQNLALLSNNRNYNQKPCFIFLTSEFLGNRLRSYSTPLTFELFYTTQDGRLTSGSRKLNHPILILEVWGDNKILYHYLPYLPQPNAFQRIKINLVENSFTPSSNPNYPEPVSRQTLMSVLQNVKSIKLLALYDPSQTLVRLTKINMGDAGTYNHGKGKAVLVEECRCPPGYSGYSCEKCSDGYELDKRPGDSLGSCVSCSCNGHSNQCDPVNKRCTNCQHNTEGDRCDRCKIGYYGNALTGTINDCKPCACPLTHPSNNFSPTCVLDSDNQMTCNQCPRGFAGRKCQACANGYTGSPTNVGDSCRPIAPSTPSVQDRPPISSICDLRGALSPYTDRSGACMCKALTSGPTCNTCKANAFYLAQENPNGCIGCFCMGISKDCQSCRFFRKKVSYPLVSRGQSPRELVTKHAIAPSSSEQRIGSQEDVGIPFVVTANDPRGTLAEVKFNGDTGRVPTLYWKLPSHYLGNKVSSYGGHIRYSIQVNGYGHPNTAPEVEIMGNGIHLVYDSDQRSPIPIQPVVRIVRLYENNWKRNDGNRATREHLMMALVNLQRVVIKLTHYNSTLYSSIKDLSIELADENKADSSGMAHAVERCNCPPGYKGLSCEKCAPGYTRTEGGFYLGLCKPCSCNGRSNECDTNNGVCKNCRDSTGDNCDRCNPGFYGRPQDSCRPCSCPAIAGIPGTCRIDMRDNQVTCERCPPGHIGKKCERCAPPYSPHPSNPDLCYLPPQTTTTQTTIVTGRSLSSMLRIIVNEPRHLILDEGETATFVCNIIKDSQEGFKISWAKLGYSNKPLPDKAEDLIGILKIPNVRLEDSGLYICTASTKYQIFEAQARLDVKAKRYEQLKVFVIPTLINANEGDDASFDCQVQGGNGDVVINWYKHNDNLHPSYKTNGTIIEFKNVRSSDSGLYVCEVSSPNGRYRSTSRLLVDFAKRDTSSLFPFTEPRTSPSSKPPSSIPFTEWVTFTSASIPQILSTSTTVSTTMESSSPSTSQTPTSTQAIITLASIPDVAPMAVARPRELSLRIGSSAILACAITGRPVPNIRWIRTDGKPISASHKIYGNQLRIISAVVEDSGTYVCKVSNYVGSTQAEITLHVKALSTPGLTVYPSNSQSVKVGGQVQFECRLNAGESGSALVWKRLGNKEIHRQTTQVFDGILRFTNVVGKEKGEYECSSSNSAGVTSRTVSLNIEGVPTLTITPSSPVRAIEGGSLNLECTAEGEPLPKVYWSLPKRIVGTEGSPTLPSDEDDEELRAENREVRRGDIPSASAIFEITDLRPSDSGRYVCTAKNALGVVQETLDLIVNSLDGNHDILNVVRILPKFLNYKSGDSTQLNCMLSGQTQYKVEWKRPKGYFLPRNYYTVDDGRGLVIPKLSTRDAGDYICEASLDNVYFSSTATINVQRRIELTVSPATQTIEEGHSFTIACSARFLDDIDDSSSNTHDNFVKLTWSKVSMGEASSSPDWSQFLRSGVSDYSGLLEVTEASIADGGRYVCTGHDSYGNAFDGNAISADVRVEPVETRSFSSGDSINAIRTGIETRDRLLIENNAVSSTSSSSNSAGERVASRERLESMRLLREHRQPMSAILSTPRRIELMQESQVKNNRIYLPHKIDQISMREMNWQESSSSGNSDDARHSHNAVYEDRLNPRPSSSYTYQLANVPSSVVSSFSNASHISLPRFQEGGSSARPRDPLSTRSGNHRLIVMIPQRPGDRFHSMRKGDQPRIKRHVRDHRCSELKTKKDSD